ncbi:unnamed protein product [Schistosoma turkestanicum]|nr:unnamed protein product [Schistosoma turkestanicum]
MIIIPGINTLPYRTPNKYLTNFQDYDNNNFGGYWNELTPNPPMDSPGNEYDTNNLQYVYAVQDYRRPALGSPFKTINEEAIQGNQQRVPYNVAEMEDMDGDKLKSSSDDGGNEDKYRRLDSLEKISVYY